jgi:hypothetical protein
MSERIIFSDKLGYDGIVAVTFGRFVAARLVDLLQQDLVD